MNTVESLLIKYEGDGFDLGVLGESFSGFSSILKDLGELSGIQGEIQIQTTRIEHGSVNVYNVINFIISSNPFTSPQDLYEFLKIASPELLHHVQSYFSEIGGVHRDINTYFKEHPFEAGVLGNLFTQFLIGSFRWAGKLKKNPINFDNDLGEISQRQAQKLRQMIMSGKYKRALKPITEGNFRKISVDSITPGKSDHVTISEENVGEYLPDDERILPELENGSIHNMTGNLVALQSTKGEVLTIRVNDINQSFSLLRAHPSDEKSTEDYKDFYKKDITFKAEIVRATMFKKPELVIREMALLQMSLAQGELEL